MSELEIFNINNKKEIRDVEVDTNFKRLRVSEAAEQLRYFFVEKNDDGSISFFSVQLIGTGIIFKSGAKVVEEGIFYKDCVKINQIEHSVILRRILPINCGKYDIIEELTNIYGKYFVAEFNKYLALDKRNFYIFVTSAIKALNKKRKSIHADLCNYSEIPCNSIKEIARLKRPLSTAYVQRVNNNSVVRLFMGCDGEVIEHSRIYTKGEKSYFCHLSLNGRYIVNEKIFSDMFDFAIADKDDLEGTHIGYCFTFDSVKLCMSLYSKGFENLTKMELPFLYDFFANYNDYDSIEDKLKIFGAKDLNANSFSKMCGIPQYLLKTVDDFLGHINEGFSTSSIDCVKWLIQRCKEGIDVDSFNDALYYELNIRQVHGNYLLDVIDEILDSFPNAKLTDILSYISKVKRGLSYEYHDYIFTIVRYHLLDYGFVWNTDDIAGDHDRAVEFANVIEDDDDEKRYSNKFEEQIEVWSNYEFSDEQYSVICPKKVKDILVEGKELKHCVRTYLQDISNGKTIVMFIRKTDDIGTPFYTLEIRNNAIRQCHGKCNSDVTFEISKFLHKYCKYKKIKELSDNRALPV